MRCWGKEGHRLDLFEGKKRFGSRENHVRGVATATASWWTEEREGARLPLGKKIGSRGEERGFALFWKGEVRGIRWRSRKAGNAPGEGRGDEVPP